MNLRQIVPALALATLALAPAFTGAAEPAAAPTRVVSYADLNLATAAGQRTLQQRITGAARAVCAPLDGQSLRENRAWRACVAQAIAAAESAVPTAPLAAQSVAAPAAR